MTRLKAAGDHASRLGVFRARDMVVAGYPREYLRRLVGQEQVRPLGRGLYASAGFDGGQNQSLVEAAKRVPRGVVCLVSALQFHGIGVTFRDLIAYCRLAIFAPHPKVKAVGGALRPCPAQRDQRGGGVEIAQRYYLDRV